MGEAHGSVDLDITSEFVCRMYAQSKTRDVNEARYNKLMQMTGKVDEVIKARESLICSCDWINRAYGICD